MPRIFWKLISWSWWGKLLRLPWMWSHYCCFCGCRVSWLRPVCDGKARWDNNGYNYARQQFCRSEHEQEWIWCWCEK